jgi:sporulation protein YlmC with PRC-barrel domain
MAIRVSSVSETWMKDVFTDKGLYCGKVEDVECDLGRFKLRSLIVKAIKGSYMTKMLGSKKGMIIPFPMVEAIGDIIIIKHITAPATEETEMPEQTPIPE